MTRTRQLCLAHPTTAQLTEILLPPGIGLCIILLENASQGAGGNLEGDGKDFLSLLIQLLLVSVTTLVV